MATSTISEPAHISVRPTQLCYHGPLAMRHHRHSFDRKTHSSTKQHSETHIGVPQGLSDANLESMISTALPFSTQSVVTTTTTITTTVTTNMTACPGNHHNGFKPWYSTSTRTDVHE